MRNWRIILSVFALCIIVVGVGGALVTALSTDTYQSYSEDQVIESKDIDHIKINTDSARVTITQTDKPNIQILVSGKGDKFLNKRYDVTSVQSTLDIQLKVDPINRWANFTSIHTPTYLEIGLPAKLYQSIHIRNENSGIEIHDQEIQEVNAIAVNGRVQLENIVANTVEARSVNGGIELNQVDGILSGRTTNGSLSVITTHINKKMTLTSTNGSIRIQTEEEPEHATFITETDNGRVDLFDKYKKSAVLGNGDPQIELSTVNGSITVSKK
ncbi:DUF4097 family beta strand repeat protein [Hazenella sp. IB182353]|uniref:DUF4097 family beta strand repeat-containing protein n=1 Tax=Polycladospora coralii TaxID=2771432 RepID=UPI001746D0DD|nr:DUF4097 family beta strand repeat-containing protein [Polycladospora coralii]MBS7531220.1 DUF4097 family beta strand repeat protein [Polycladospora coralii]